MSAGAAKQSVKVLEVQNKQLLEKMDAQKAELAQTDQSLEEQEAR